MASSKFLGRLRYDDLSLLSEILLLLLILTNPITFVIPNVCQTALIITIENISPKQYSCRSPWLSCTTFEGNPFQKTTRRGFLWIIEPYEICQKRQRCDTDDNYFGQAIPLSFIVKGLGSFLGVA